MKKKWKQILAGGIASLMVFQIICSDSELVIIAENMDKSEIVEEDSNSQIDNNNEMVETLDYNFMVIEKTENEEKGKPIAGAVIVIKNGEEIVGEPYTTDEEGKVRVVLDKNMDTDNCSYTVTEENHLEYTGELESLQIDIENLIELEVKDQPVMEESNPEIDDKNEVVETLDYNFMVTEKTENGEKGKPIVGAAIVIKNGEEMIGESYITDEGGKVSVVLDKNTDINNCIYIVTEENYLEYTGEMKTLQIDVENLIQLEAKDYTTIMEKELKKSNSDQGSETVDIIDGAWDGTSIEVPELSGYEYKIDSAAKLAWFAQEVNNQNTFEGKSIFITGDINLNKKEWLVIGNTTPENPCEIKGNIVIKDAVINGLLTSANNPPNRGLFGSVRVWDVQIDNLNMEDVNISTTNRSYDSFLFASLEIARNGVCNIINSNFSGVIEGKSQCGALAGYVSGVNDNAILNITNCNITIESTTYGKYIGCRDNSPFKGGVIARYYAPATNNKLILNGVDCEVNLVTYKEYGYSECATGGMLGELEGNASVFVYQCAVSGTIISSAYWGFAGGIVGKMKSCNTYKQSDTCVTTSIQSSWKAYGYPYNAGGFVEGPTEKKPDGYIRNSYFAGKSGSTAAFIAKDCFGDDNRLKIYNCYYDSTLSTNRVYHTDWKCYNVNNTVFDCNAYSTENMGIQTNFVGWDFDKIWTMGEFYPELRRSNFELPSDFEEDNSVIANQSEIVRVVREYASQDFYAQWEAIWNSDYSNDVKAEKILALASNYGITDPREGLEFVSKSHNKRWAYRILTTDEMYMASNFLNWLDEDGNFERALLAADGLIFNREMNQWLDISTYVESDYPGISKYKDMLYAYMDSTCNSIEAWNDVKLVSELSKNVTNADELWVNEKITQLNALNNAGDRETRKKIIDEMEKKGVFFDGDIKDNGNLDVTYTYKLDKNTGFGKFAQAMGYATKTISIVDMAISDIQDILILDSKLQTYYQFEEFLNDIIEAKNDVPFELRVAAKQVLIEIEDGYWNEVKKIAGQMMKETKISSTVKESVLSALGAKSFSSYLSMINIEAWFINQIVDVGSVVKNEAYVEGYAYLTRLYKKRLENSRENFLNSMTEENAWEFYYNYNMLYSLRHKGEEAYLNMCGVKGLCGKLLSIGYATKEEGVNKVLSILEDSCKFDLGEVVDIPESMEYLSKLVVSCPVDVNIYTLEGDVIAELRDTELKDISNEYGRFAVVYNYYTGDYEKVVCLLDTEVRIEILAKDAGLVNLEFAYMNESDEIKILNLSNTPVMEGDIISLTSDGMKNNGTALLKKGDESKELKFRKDDSAYINLTNAFLSEKEISLTVGESKLLTVSVEPQNASVQDMSWYSSDPDIVTVKNGNVKALREGEAVIYGILHDNNEPLVCNVTVSTADIAETIEIPAENIMHETYNDNLKVMPVLSTVEASVYYTMDINSVKRELSLKLMEATELITVEKGLKRWKIRGDRSVSSQEGKNPEILPEESEISEMSKTTDMGEKTKNTKDASDIQDMDSQLFLILILIGVGISILGFIWIKRRKDSAKI